MHECILKVEFNEILIASIVNTVSTLASNYLPFLNLKELLMKNFRIRLMDGVMYKL